MSKFYLTFINVKDLSLIRTEMKTPHFTCCSTLATFEKRAHAGRGGASRGQVILENSNHLHICQSFQINMLMKSIAIFLSDNS